MNDQAKKARAAYQREWAKKNPDKIKEYARRHWEKVARETTEKEVVTDEH